MSLQMWLENLAAHSLQVAVLAAAGTALVMILRLRMPTVLLALWQGLLAACLLLPALQPWQLARSDVDARQPGTASSLVETAASVAGQRDSVPAGTAAAPIGRSPFPICPAILLILVTGIVLRLAWTALGILRLHYYRAKARRPATLPDSIREMQRRLGVRPDIFLSDEIGSPVTFGWHRPAVILPESFAAMGATMQRPIACHELIHVLRRDWPHILAEEILLSLFWFHPAIWWMLARIRLSREQVVDREVLMVTGERGPYLESLLFIASLRGRPAPVPAPLLLRERHLAERVALMLKESAMTRSRLFASLAIAVACLILTGTLAAGWFPFTAPAAKTPGPAQSTVTTISQPAESAQDRILLDYNNTDLVAVIRTLANFLGYAPIEIERDLRGSVTFHSNRPLLQAEVKQVFEDILKNNQAALVKSGDLYRVVRRPEPGGALRAPAAAAKTPQRETLRVGSNVQMPKLISKVEPVYPELARRARVEGEVVLDVRINETGEISDLRVIQGHPLLDQAAMDAVKQWRYQPTLVNGKPVPVQTTVSISFRGSGMIPVRETEFLAPATVPREAPAQATAAFAPAPRSVPVRVGGNIQAAGLIRKVDPVYPEVARQARVSGVVYLEVTVNEAGEVAMARVLKGHPLLNQAAIEAVAQWRYEPTIINGVTVPVIATVTVVFNLSSNTAVPAIRLNTDP